MQKTRFQENNKFEKLETIPITASERVSLIEADQYAFDFLKH